MSVLSILGYVLESNVDTDYMTPYEMMRVAQMQRIN